MPRYTPILKGRDGELQALRNLTAPELRAAPPLVELTAGSNGVIDPAKLGTALRGLPTDGAITVDAAHGGAHALTAIERTLSQGKTPLRGMPRDHPGLIPVARIDDPPEARSASRAIAGEYGQRVMLRVGTPHRDPEPAEIEEHLPRLFADLDVDAHHVDLLVDLQEVASQRDVDRALPVVRRVLDWAHGRPWRTITLASGAFPEGITHLPQETVSVVQRYDAALWKAVNVEVGTGEDIGFGDYAIAHPQHPEPGPGRASPSLRYTQGEAWDVHRQRASPEHGFEAFQLICKYIVEDDDWVGSDFCWGDSEIALCAAGERTMGNATKWRAWATSHHLAWVTRRLANHGVP